MLELDITSYFDSIVREQLMEMIEKRISDASILRLLRKWINVGVIDEGRLLVSETGTGQGQIVSPLLANVYLHYVLDEWFETEVKPRLKGQAFAIRYADDGLLCFERQEDAEKVLEVLPKRFAKYGLTLHPEKTRLVKFGRSALTRAEREGAKPATFDFLGFTHQCARSRRGKFTVHVKTMKKRLRRSLKAVSEWCRRHRHDDVAEQHRTLNAKIRGHYQYYGRPTNYRSLWRFFRAVRCIWKKWLNRRTRGRTLTWARTPSSCIAIRSHVPGSHGLGPVRRVQPEEPTAVVPHGGVREGRGGKPLRLLGVPGIGSPPPAEPCPPGQGHRNTRGLTAAGRDLIDVLMRNAMLIDIDHMSERASDEVLAQARDFPSGWGYPLVSGHNGARDHGGGERGLRSDQLEAIRDRGGMLGLGWAKTDASAFRNNLRVAHGLMGLGE